MGVLGSLGKLFSGFGNVTDFLPNQALKALHLPPLTNPTKMFGDLAQGKGLKNFGTEWGNNAKLGAGAAAVGFGGPAILHAFGVGGGASAAMSEGLPSGTVASVAAPPVGWSGWNPAVHMGSVGIGNMTQGMGGASGLANAVAGGGGGYGASTFAAPASGTTGGGLIGPGGGAVGTGAEAGAAAKPMNPILKSFLDSYMKRFSQKPENPQTYQAPSMPNGRPGRQYLPTLGGY